MLVLQDRRVKDFAFIVLYNCVDGILHLREFCRKSIIASANKVRIIELASLTEINGLLRCSFDSQIFGTLRTIKLYMWGTIATTETRMLSNTELIEFPNNFIEVLAKWSEDNSKFSFLFFIVNESSEEGWN